MTLFSAWLLVLLFVCVGGVDERYSERLDVAAFGSCNKQHKPQPFWSVIARFAPSLWLWTGDAVYPNDTSVESLRSAIDAQRAGPGSAPRPVGAWRPRRSPPPCRRGSLSHRHGLHFLEHDCAPSLGALPLRRASASRARPLRPATPRFARRTRTRRRCPTRTRRAPDPTPPSRRSARTRPTRPSRAP